jgi:hypothetical protein
MALETRRDKTAGRQELKMADSNVVELREWFGKEAPNGVASHEECLQIIRAFIQIRDPSLRTLLIRSAQAAAAKRYATPSIS